MNHMPNAVILCALFLASFGRAQETPAGPVNKGAEGRPAEGVDAFVQAQMAKRHVPGVSVAVVKDGKVVLAKGYGLASVELGVPATADTVYQLASVTKTFTATAVMMLAKEGKLSLDDRVTERLTGLPAAWKDVTVRHLLNHTSGIKSYTSVPDFHQSPRKDYAPGEILAFVTKEPMDFRPGEKWSYNNTGYLLLGMLIEKVTGKPYGEFMAERVFKPLGMSRTRANDLRAIVPGRAQGYQWDGKELKNGEHVSPSQPFAAGMLLSSVGDLVKWDAAIASHTLLDEQRIEEMWKPTRLGGGGEAEYGYGWSTAKVNGRRHVSHGGGIQGFSTELSRFPEDRLTVIVLTNADGGHAEAIARKVAGLYVPALATKAEAPIADKDPATTARLRGIFEGALKGEVDEKHFSDEAKKRLVPRIREDKLRLASFGALKAFQLLERKEHEGGQQLHYRVVLENETLQMSFSLDKDGKIQGAGIRPEE